MAPQRGLAMHLSREGLVLELFSENLRSVPSTPLLPKHPHYKALSPFLYFSDPIFQLGPLSLHARIRSHVYRRWLARRVRLENICRSSAAERKMSTWLFVALLHASFLGLEILSKSRN